MRELIMGTHPNPPKGREINWQIIKCTIQLECLELREKIGVP